MPKLYPEEVKHDVVAVARRRQQPLREIAEDFGISTGWSETAPMPCNGATTSS